MLYWLCINNDLQKYDYFCSTKKIGKKLKKNTQFFFLFYDKFAGKISLKLSSLKLFLCIVVPSKRSEYGKILTRAWSSF